jgi:hypothetical protein
MHVILEFVVALWGICVYTVDGERVCACCELVAFFCRANTPSMDRDWRGSIPPPSRYHTAIGRARPDPEEDPGDPHTRSLTHRLSHPRDLHLYRSKMADELLTGHLITHLSSYL